MTNLNTPTIGDNHEAALKDVWAEMSRLGRTEAAGNTCRRDSGIYACEQAFAGILGSEHAEKAYDAYVNSRSKTLRAKKSNDTENVKSRTAQISKLNAFIKLGCLPAPIDGPALLDKAVESLIRLSLNGIKVESDFVALGKVATSQVARPDQPLTDLEIDAALSKKESAPKEDIDKLIASYKALRKLATDIPCAGTTDAAEAMAAAIVEMGGEVPMTKAEKDEAEFMAKFAANAHKYGFTATPKGNEHFSFRTDGVDDAIIIQPRQIAAH